MVTALGALRAKNLTLEADGSILIQGGTSNLNAASTFAASNALLLVETSKNLTTRNGGSVIIKGGTANVSPALSTVSARNALAIAQLDPSVLDMTVDGSVVLHSGVTSGPLGALASARIDAGDEIKITVNGAPQTYSFNHSQSGPTSLFGQFFMIGAPTSGFYDANDVPLTGSVFPITVNVPVTQSVDPGRGDSIVQTGLVTFIEDAVQLAQRRHHIQEQHGEREHVAEADLVGRGRVVLVHDRHRRKREERVKRAANVDVRPSVGDLGAGQKHLGGPHAVAREDLLPGTLEPRLPERRGRLQPWQRARPRGQSQ